MLSFIVGQSELAQHIRAFPWHDTEIGELATWPEALRTLVSVMLESNQPMFIVWGPGRRLIYNDRYASILQGHHPAALGRPILEVWSEIADDLRPLVEDAYAGRATHTDDIMLMMERNGYPEETHFAYSYTPIRREGGTVDGFFCACIETTSQVVATRTIRESEVRNRQIFDSATDYAIIATDRDGLVTSWNEGGVRVLGWTEAEMLGQSVDRFFTPEDRAADRPAIETRCALVTGSASDERWHLRKDGQRFWGVGKMTVLRDAAGEPAGFVKVLSDRTHEHVAAQALREAEAAARTNSERVQLALSAGAIIGTWFWDLTQDQFKVDGAFADAFGLDPALGREGIPLAKIVETVHPDDQHGLAAAIEEAVARGGAYAHQYRVRRHDGRYYWIEANGRVDHAPDGTPISFPGVLIDVERRRTVEAERDKAIADLRAANEQLKAENLTRARELNRMWNVTREPLAITDLHGRLVAVNPAWTTVLGWTEQELVGATSEWLEHPDDRSRTRGEAVGLSDGMPLVAFEQRLRTRDGDYRTLSWTCVPEGELIYRSARDVTNERAHAAQLQMYGNIVESDASPIVAWGPDCRITVFNRAHADAYKRVYGIDQAIGDALLDQFIPEQADMVGGFMARALAGERFTVQARIGHPALELPTWEIHYAPVMNEAGEIVGAFHNARDITAELASAAELDRTQEALRQSQKLEAVGQLTGGVAHDFNNLLTIIRSSVDLLRRSDLREDRRERYLDAMSDTVDRAAKLTGQLLAFARRQALKPEVFDVSAKLRDITYMLDTVTGGRVQIVVEAPERACFIRADVSQFETALVNLVVNARDAMDGAGRLVLQVGCDAAMPPIRGHAGSDTRFATVSVADTGSGIAPEQLAHIFEPFFTTKEVGKGTGLGLSQVFGFAKQSGGDVDVASEPGGGATFTLYLPEVEEPQLASEAADLSSAPIGAGQHVLVVEDNLEVGRFCTQILEDLGYRTTWATNAEDALERLGPDGTGFDIVFSDVIMPGIGGVSLADTLRKRLPELPVVLASGYSHILAQEGGHDYELLHKPYSAEQLSRILQRMLATRPAVPAR